MPRLFSVPQKAYIASVFTFTLSVFTVSKRSARVSPGASITELFSSFSMDISAAAFMPTKVSRIGN